MEPFSILLVRRGENGNKLLFRYPYASAPPANHVDRLPPDCSPYALARLGPIQVCAREPFTDSFWTSIVSRRGWRAGGRNVGINTRWFCSSAARVLSAVVRSIFKYAVSAWSATPCP